VLEPVLNYFRRQALPDENTFKLCYLSAYDALPAVVHADPEGFWRTYYLARYPGLGWHAHLALVTGSDLGPFTASTLKWHKGRLENGREYLILEYPEPEPVGEEFDEFLAGRRSPTEQLLCPYFSAVLRTTPTRPSVCYALGQSPVDGETTLRLCRPAAHYNLGSGPPPTLESFIKSLEEIHLRKIQGATVRHPNHLEPEDHELMN